MASKIISYPAYISEVSIYIGRLRDMMSARMNDSAPQFKRGDKSSTVNVLGVFGELVFAHHLHTTGVDFEQAVLLDPSPLPGPDFIVGQNKIDVKTVGSEAPDLLVNVDAFHKKPDITHYVFIQAIGENRARYWTFKRESIAMWPIKDVRYSNAYFKKISAVI